MEDGWTEDRWTGGRWTDERWTGTEQPGFSSWISQSNLSALGNHQN